MSRILIKGSNVVFCDSIEQLDVLIEPPFIKQIDTNIQTTVDSIIEAQELYLFPGIIDTHVHFREPGLTHKGSIYSESQAAVAGGITTVIDMPNTIPFAGDIETIQSKKLLYKNSFVNIGFFVGATNENIKSLIQFPKNEVAGIKVFLGSSTGNVMVQDNNLLNFLFSNSYLPIAIHAETEEIIQNNLSHYKEIFGENIPYEYHPLIRNKEACIDATQKAIELAKKHQTKIHILHVSTFEELDLINPDAFPNITAEVCIPHLWFTQSDFSKLNGFLKCNPSVKTEEDRENLRKAINTNKIYTIGTDHAPHTYDEKQKPYLQCPSGTTSIQHSLLSMIQLSQMGYFELTQISKKMAYNPSKKFQIKNRGEIKPGYYADLTLVDLNTKTFVNKQNILYKCQWTPFEGHVFPASIVYTFVNGNIAYEKHKMNPFPCGMLIEYNQ